MAKRLHSIGAGFSTGILAIMLCLAMASPWIEPGRHYLSVSKQCHVSVWGRSWDVRLVAFNDTTEASYRGSIIRLVSDQGIALPTLVREAHWGDAAGIYFRYFRWTDRTLWTLMVSIWYPIALLSLWPGWWIMHKWRVRMHKASAHV